MRRWLACAAAVALAGVAWSAGPSEAEQQYRVARRLAAEGSPEAVEALHRVVDLDPAGPLADDALLDLAMVEGIPFWPEELGRIGAGAVGRASKLLQHLLDTVPGGDRAPEARLRLALLRLEPVAGRDPSAARLELVTVATGEGESALGLHARYVLGWLDASTGRVGPASAAFHRLLVDHPESEAASRARVGLARLELREGKFGESAFLLDQVVDREPSVEPAALDLLDLAVRCLLLRTGGGGAWDVSNHRSWATGMRSPTSVELLPDGGAVVADPRSARIVRFGAEGRPSMRWELEQVQAMAVDPWGRVVAAAGDGIYRLDPSGPARVADLGGFEPVSGMTVDGEGRIWISDRRGDRVGAVEPGTTAPRVVREAKGSRWVGLAWDGSRVVAAQARTGDVLALDGDGRVRTVASGVAAKPVALAADPAGNIAVLDLRTRQVVRIAPNGAILDRVSLQDLGVVRGADIAVGTDGSLSVLDGSGGSLTRVP